MADFGDLAKLYRENLDRDAEMAAGARAGKYASAQRAYDGLTAALQQNYEAGSGQVNRSYDTSVAQQNQTAEAALRDAYVSKMLNARAMNQQLGALGKSGGAAESTLLGLQNNYQTNRAGLERERGRAVESLNLARAGELTDLLKALNSGKANANDAYQNRLMGAEDDYVTALMEARSAFAGNQAKLLASQLEYEKEQEAIRQRAAAAAAKGTAKSESTRTNNPIWGNADMLAKQLKQQGYSDKEAARYINNLMVGQGVSEAVRRNTLYQLGF